MGVIILLSGFMASRSVLCMILFLLIQNINIKNTRLYQITPSSVKMVNMRKNRLSKLKQDKLIEHFVAGTTARCAASLVCVIFKTAAYYFRRLR